MMNTVSTALKSACDDFCSFIDPTITKISTDQEPTSFNLVNTLTNTEEIADDFPALLEEALNEPNFWKRPFIEVKDRYDNISKSLQRIILNIRFIRRCTTILKAETKLNFAHTAKWQVRRASSLPEDDTTQSDTIHSWTTMNLHKDKQFQNDLDVPLTIFMNYSLRSSTRSEKETPSYQPVLEHISTLEKHIQQVISLTRQLIQNQATVDVNSFELQQIYHENSSDELPKKATLIRQSSIFPITPSAPNHLKYFPCCHIRPQNTDQPLLSLRHAVDLMFASLIQFLYANNRFIRTELISIQSIGDILAFHTLSYAFKDLVEATTDLAKNGRRIKHIDTRTLIPKDHDEKIR